MVKISFLWTLYVNNQGDNGTYIYKWDFARALQMENVSLPSTGSHRTAEILTNLFGPNDKVTFEQFRSWLLIHKDATVLSKWLLSGKANAVQDLDTPTFYQSLAGVTHLEERIGPECFSVHGRQHRTSNIAESYHAALARSLGPAPNIWQFTKTISAKFQICAARRRAQLAGNAPPPRRNRERQMVRAATVANNVAALNRGGINIADFLIMSSRLINVNVGLLAEEVPDVGREIEVEVEFEFEEEANDELPPARNEIIQAA